MTICIVCGDGVCELNRNETCSACPADCGICSSSDNSVIIIAASVSGAGFILTILLVYLYLQYKKAKMLRDTDALWRIDLEDIDMRETTSAQASQTSVLSAASRASSKRSLFGSKRSLIGSLKGRSNIGLIGGDIVYVREVKDCDVKVFSKEMIQEARSTYLIDFKYLAKFKAIGFDQGVPRVIASEFFKKGSLFDLVHMEQSNVLNDFSFSFSLCYDVARGLNYLHKLKLFHGHLSSSNCLIGRDFSARIGDFWLKDLLYGEEIPEEYGEEEREFFLQRSKKKEVANKLDLVDGLLLNNDFFNLLWVDPLQIQEPYSECSQGDIFSFSCILGEVMTGLEPYVKEYEEMGALGVLEEIFKGSRLRAYMKPQDLLYDDSKAMEVYQLCIDIERSPERQRPSMQELLKKMSSLNPNKNQDAVDLMVAKLDAYSQNLEQMVIEATEEARFEQERSEKLLDSILPQSVIQQLKTDPKAKIATKHNNVTVFFSDIVGFTNMSRQVSAEEVVDMLNRIFTILDGLSTEFELTKIKTIGDAYMAACGVPRDDDNHAHNVCLFACYSVICLANEKGTTGEPLGMRCGVHSGKLVAGIVGTKSFAFDLWGDTVNVASRMESNGEPGKVCCSSSTYEILKGRWNFTEREPREIKGQGLMTTYIVHDPKGRKIKLADVKELLQRLLSESENKDTLFPMHNPGHSHGHPHGHGHPHNLRSSLMSLHSRASSAHATPGVRRSHHHQPRPMHAMRESGVHRGSKIHPHKY